MINRLVAVCIAFVMLFILVPFGFAVFGQASVRREEGWVIERFSAKISIERDATLTVVESIDVDFGTLERHGIFRDIPYRFKYDRTHARRMGVIVSGVTDASGRAVPRSTSTDENFVHVRIGDANRFVTGKQSYRISYRVMNALNPFPDHDELYWNVNGAAWPVPTREVDAMLAPPAPVFERILCYQGGTGAKEFCDFTGDAAHGEFHATRSFVPGEQLTIVASIRKGALPVPPLALDSRDLEFSDFFETTPVALGAAGALLVAGLAFVGRSLWSVGRDREYVTNFYLNQDPTERTRPLLAYEAVVPEYEPPEKLRPAQVGLLLDEGADPKDLTATIVDMAVRGYLAIEEQTRIQVFGFSIKDYKLTKKREGTDLLPYEETLFIGLFGDRGEVRLSELTGTFHGTLSVAQSRLYDDSVKQQWFSEDPEKERQRWGGAGCLVFLAGPVLAFVLGMVVGWGLVGVVAALLGVVTLVASRWIPRRTAKGSELLKRILGFRLYMETAEKDRAKFAEQQNLFTQYLPYAIVFGSVTKWARAFESLDVAAATSTWYVGTTPFTASSFGSNLEGFSSSVSSAIVSTPGGGGGSGFSGGGGGGAGGGGGGGGGGSW